MASMASFDNVRAEDLREQKERLSAKKSFESFDSSDSECSLEGGFPWWYPCGDEWYVEEIVGGYEAGLNLNKGRARYCRVPLDYVSSVERRPILEMVFPTQKVPKWTEPFTHYEKAFKTWDLITIKGLHADIIPRVLHRITVWDSDGIPISFTKPPHTAVAKLDNYFITGRASILMAAPPALGCGGCKNVFTPEGQMIRHRHSAMCGFVFSSVTENDEIRICKNVAEGASFAALLAALVVASATASTHVPEFIETGSDTDSCVETDQSSDTSEDWSDDDEEWPTSCVSFSQQEMLDFPELLRGL